MEILGNLEGVFADLYPYRWPISVVFLLAVGGALYIAWRRDWHRALARRPMATALVVVPLLAIGLPVSYYLVSPLWTRTYLEEASPLVLAGVMSTPTSVAASIPKTEPDVHSQQPEHPRANINHGASAYGHPATRTTASRGRDRDYRTGGGRPTCPGTYQRASAGAHGCDAGRASS